LIDIHFHCLPGIDDGPRDWDEAIALCKAAEAEGTDTIVATPHVLRDRWINDDPRARDTLIVKLNNLLGGKPAVLPGCEYLFSADALELWQGKDPRPGPLTPINRSSYLLVEFPADRVSDQAEAVFHEFSMIGVKPVIAHPERNAVFASNSDRLARLVELGALVQITCASVLGFFGKPVVAACNEFFRRRLVHCIASDAHSIERRPPQLAPAREWVRKTWGAEAESVLFDRNPAAVVANAPLQQL
jgi:protein-tyrosine phosphatase